MLVLQTLVVSLCLTTGLTVDLTSTPNTSGREVVEAVVNRIRNHCLLTDDRFLLRRLAYVESLDGEDPDTYRSDNNGGIWKIDEARFQRTRSCSGSSTRRACDQIREAFGITWEMVTWSDLRKPLYSGLAATIFILSHDFDTLPQGVEEQAQFWGRFYRPGANSFIYKLRAKQIQYTGCDTQLDLAFILDGSGSIQQFQFDNVLSFVNNVTLDFPISNVGVQVAFVEYSSTVGTTYPLNSIPDRQSLNAAISSITKSGQTTNTAAAIDEITSSIFTANQGARTNAKRVAVLLTDGASGDRLATIAAAQRAKDKGIVVFAVGVGTVNDEELAAVASSPSCTHFYKLKNFDEVGFMVHEIKKQTCGAPKLISETPTEDTPSTVTTPLVDNPVTNTFVLNTDTNTTFVVDTGSSGSGNNGQKVIKTEVTCGILKIYASYDHPNPGPAFYELTAEAADGRPSITKVETTRQGRKLYITVIGTKLHESCSDVMRCKNAKYTLSVEDAPTSAEVTVICKTWEGERVCTQEDITHAGFSSRTCPDDGLHAIVSPKTQLTNPCPSNSASTLIYAHPQDVTAFIVCDVNGEMYVTSCPDNGVFNPATNACNNAPIFSLTATSILSAESNVCSRSRLVPYKTHYPHPTDNTKFIVCDRNKEVVQKCGPGTFYNDQIQNCDWAPGKRVDIVIPEDLCRNVPQGSTFSHSDPTQYIVCLFRTPVIMPCPYGTRWNQAAKRCS